MCDAINNHFHYCMWHERHSIACDNYSTLTSFYTDGRGIIVNQPHSHCGLLFGDPGPKKQKTCVGTGGKQHLLVKSSITQPQKSRQSNTTASTQFTAFTINMHPVLLRGSRCPICERSTKRTAQHYLQGPDIQYSNYVARPKTFDQP